MGDNKEGKMQKMKEAANGMQEGAKLAANIASGNIAGAAKSIANMVKSKEFKKQLKKRIISSIILSLIPIFCILSYFGIVNALKNTLIDLLSSAATSISTFLSDAWQYLTDDYWIKIDEKKEYNIDIKTGEPLDEPENYSIIDKYIKELGTQGVTLDSLRLLGDNADYSDKEKLLEDENNRELVEKYIAEFIRADIITQQPHRRRGKELVNPNNQNYVDGGVYIYRTTKELELKEEDFVDGGYSEENVAVEGDNYKKMDYMDPDEFEQSVKEINEKGKSSSAFSGIKSDVEKLRYSFSIDKETGELMIVEIKTKEIKRNTTEGLNAGFLGINNLSRWLQDKLNAEIEYELTIKRLDYKSLISKYTMPYEFLINLCNVTQNPEFVYHVALLARETNIVLAIQDNTTMEVEANLTQHIERKRYSNSSPSFNGASISDLDPFQEEETITTTTQTPNLQIEYADTWSFYEEFEYTKNIRGTIEEHDTGEVTIQPSGDWSYVSEHEEPTLDPTMANPDGSPGMIKIPEHYELEATTKRRDITKLITTETTYNEPILSQSVEKRKQFLGLIRNKTGKCEHDDCFTQSTWIREDPIALQCAKDAVFVKDGINVRYQIPNMTRTEDVYDNLRSGIDMIYAVLQSNSSGYSEKDKKLGDDGLGQRYDKEEEYVADGDYESAYIVRMQGLAEHLRFLMTFPDPEVYTIKDLLLEIFSEEDDDQDDRPIESGYDFWWPLDENVDCRISSYFGKRKAPTGGASTFHKGIDIARPLNGGSIEGAAIIASADGVVTVSTYHEKAGNYIVIDHENGYQTRYLHNNQNLVSVGDRVTRGQVIAYLGSTGNVTGPHLHFEIILNGVEQDPLNYVSMKNKRPSGAQIEIDDKEKLDIIYAIVASECSSDYEGSLAVITCVLNRCNSSAWSSYGGNDPYLQITAKGQFSYGIPEYQNAHKKYLNGNVPEHVKNAVNDALSGKRNHNYTSFRTDTPNTRKIHPNGKSIGGNWYFNN